MRPAVARVLFVLCLSAVVVLTTYLRVGLGWPPSITILLGLIGGGACGAAFPLSVLLGRKW